MGFVEAAGFLNELKIILAKDVPYPPQITALAAALSLLGDVAQSAAARENWRCGSGPWRWVSSTGRAPSLLLFEKLM